MLNDKWSDLRWEMQCDDICDVDDLFMLVWTLYDDSLFELDLASLTGAF